MLEERSGETNNYLRPVGYGKRRANGDKQGRNGSWFTIGVLDAAGGEERGGAFVQRRVAMVQAIMQLRRGGETEGKGDGG
ncbi:MAG: hypothetical protein ABI883_01875 [Chthoniobacterales bacterium]